MGLSALSIILHMGRLWPAIYSLPPPSYRGEKRVFPTRGRRSSGPGLRDLHLGYFDDVLHVIVLGDAGVVGQSLSPLGKVGRLLGELLGEDGGEDLGLGQREEAEGKRSCENLRRGRGQHKQHRGHHHP